MGQRVPMELLKLRSATTAYLSILRDVLPVLEGAAEIMDPPGTEDGQPMRELVECVRAGVEVADAPGTPTSIAAMLAIVLGET